MLEIVLGIIEKVRSFFEVSADDENYGWSLDFPEDEGANPEDIILENNGWTPEVINSEQGKIEVVKVKLKNTNETLIFILVNNSRYFER